MYIKSTPNTFAKLAQMSAENNALEVAGDPPASKPARPPHYQSHSLAECITNVSTPQGSVRLLSAMLTTACERNCFYCPFRAGRSKMKRMTSQPDEVAGTFDAIARGGGADGIFVTSGIIKGGVTTQDKIIDTGEIIRKKYRYRGYLHLKIMPGAERDQIARAMQLADRVSLNLEAPTAHHLDQLAPKKDFHGELLQRIAWAHEIRQSMRGKRASIATQFVVGAVGDSDVDLLALTQRLYQQMGLARTYFMAFTPIIDTPFENVTAVDPLREYRLYQASFLLRDYGWDVEDFGFGTAGNLPLDVDPKSAWADVHLRQTPIEIMRADRQQLMRIPGIGVKGAEAILKTRRSTHLRDLAQLRALGIRSPERAAPYITLDGAAPPQQLRLF